MFTIGGSVVAIVLIVLGFGIYKFNFTNDDIYLKTGGRLDSKDGTYVIDGKSVTLKDGYHESKAAQGLASKEITRYFGNDTQGDFNNDGVYDSAFLLSQDTGGSGTFYYVVALVSSQDKFVGTNALLIGDRIAPQTTEFRNGEIIVNYAARQPGEPMTVSPSVGISKYFKVSGSTLVEIKK